MCRVTWRRAGDNFTMNLMMMRFDMFPLYTPQVRQKYLETKIFMSKNIVIRINNLKYHFIDIK